MRQTQIVPWTAEWLDRYDKEKQTLKTIFFDELLDIHHIGSTSVPQIGFAKPIIDILVVVKQIHKVDDYNDPMIALGYIPRGEQGIVGRRYFSKGGDHRTHHVHIYEVGNIHIDYHLNFKHYLQNHPQEAKQYGELKLQLAKQSPDDVHVYQKGKEAFCTNILQRAMEWASGQKAEG